MKIPSANLYMNSSILINNPKMENKDILPLSTRTNNSSDKQEVKELELTGASRKLDSNKEQNQEWDKIVMKPSPISLEERMSQVISAEQVRDLLSLITRMPIKDREESHKLDNIRKFG